MDQWTEIRTAYTVARLGTVSAAASALGIHRGTVIRHIDTLEASIKVRLFTRHARGYTPTEAGLDLQRVAKVTDDQLGQFVDRARGRESNVRGEVIVTSVEIVAPLLTRGVARFRALHPETRVKYIASGRPLDLAYGQAHVAVRAGSKPVEPDYIVRPFFALGCSFYAHRIYVEQHGLPANTEAFADHVFVSHLEPSRTPFFRWLEAEVPPENIVLRSASQRVLIESVMAGVGIGFLPDYQAARDPNVFKVVLPRSDWSTPLWLLTHVDLHRTSKVKAICDALTTVAKELGPAANR